MKKHAFLMAMGVVGLIMAGCTSVKTADAVGAEKISVSKERFAPSGRILECQLLFPIESTSPNMPIIGLVTKNLWHAGNLIIPAGVEIHGRTSSKHIGERILTENTWTIVWRTKSVDNGKELKINGYALSKEPMKSTESWDMKDGEPGIRGELIISSQKAEIVSDISGYADNAEKESKNPESISLLRKYANKLIEDFSYAHCSGGTEFYLYVTDKINISKAELAGK